MKKLLTVAVAAVIIAAAGIGIGLSQFAKPVEQTPVNEITPTTEQEQQSTSVDTNEVEQSLQDVF